MHLLWQERYVIINNNMHLLASTFLKAVHKYRHFPLLMNKNCGRYIPVQERYLPVETTSRSHQNHHYLPSLPLGKL